MQNLTNSFVRLCCKTCCHYVIAKKLFCRQLDQLSMVISISQLAAIQIFAILSSFLQKMPFFMNNYEKAIYPISLQIVVRR